MRVTVEEQLVIFLYVVGHFQQRGETVTRAWLSAGNGSHPIGATAISLAIVIFL